MSSAAWGRRCSRSAHRISQGGREVVQGRELVGEAGPTTTTAKAGREAGGAHQISQGGREAVQGRELAGDAGPTTTARRGGRRAVGGGRFWVGDLFTVQNSISEMGR